MEWSPIVPRALTYGPRVVSGARSAARAARRAQSAYRMYGPQAYKAATKVQATYRMYKAWKERTKDIGNNVGESTTKKATGSAVGGTATRALYSLNMVSLEKSSVNDIDARQRDSVNFRGTRCCLSFMNESSDPIDVNIAVVHPRNQSVVTQTGFFRGFGTQRSEDFTTALSAHEFNCLPINADEYTVLKHMKISLAPAVGSTNAAGNASNSYKNVQFYVKLQKQLRYFSDGDAEKQTFAIAGNVWLVWWCDKMLAPSGAASTTGAMKHDVRVYKYFKETMN